MNSRILVAIALGLAVVLAISLAGGGEMTGDQIANLAYGGLLLSLVSGWAFAEIRGNVGESLRNLLIWAVLFGGIAYLYANKALFGF